MNRIALVVPCHDDAATIGETIQSIVSQDRIGDAAALILADDASRDDSVERARHAVGDRVAITVLQSPTNLGQWPNVNRALRAAETSAEWVAMLHADDIAREGWLAALIDRAERCADNVGAISTSWDMLYGERIEHTGENSMDAVRVIEGSTAAVHDTLLAGCWWKISGAAIRLRAFRDVGDFDPQLRHASDWDWTLRALSKGWSFEYIPRALTIYRQHAATVSSTSFQQDVDIQDAMVVADRFGHTLGRSELVRYHTSRAHHALRRLGRGVIRGDVGRVATSLRTVSMLGGHLAKQLF